MIGKSCSSCCVVCKIVGLLVIIGALNWGLVGVASFNLVDQLLGAGSVASRIIYGLVGLAGLLKLASCFKQCPCMITKEEPKA